MTFSHGSVRKAFHSAPILNDFAEKTQEFLDLLVFSSVYLALECVAMAYISCYLQQVPWSPECIIIPFLILGYWESRHADLRTESETFFQATDKTQTQQPQQSPQAPH